MHETKRGEQVMKKVRCLYRVSTLKQLDENDIPMQRIECQKFISMMPDWEFDKEYIEIVCDKCGNSIQVDEEDLFSD